MSLVVTMSKDKDSTVIVVVSQVLDGFPEKFGICEGQCNLGFCVNL